MSRSAYWRLESIANFELKTLIRICELLKMTLADFLKEFIFRRRRNEFINHNPQFITKIFVYPLPLLRWICNPAAKQHTFLHYSEINPAALQNRP